MSIRLSIIEKEFVLERSDKLYGNDAGKTTVTIRQATQSQNERIEGLFKGIKRRYNDKTPDEVIVEQEFSVSELRRIQAMTTLIGSNIENEAGELLFPPEILAGKGREPNEKKFQIAWGQLPMDIVDEIMEKVYEVNISWRMPVGELT